MSFPWILVHPCEDAWRDRSSVYTLSTLFKVSTRTIDPTTALPLIHSCKWWVTVIEHLSHLCKHHKEWFVGISRPDGHYGVILLTRENIIGAGDVSSWLQLMWAPVSPQRWVTKPTETINTTSGTDLIRRRRCSPEVMIRKLTTQLVTLFSSWSRPVVQLRLLRVWSCTVCSCVLKAGCWSVLSKPRGRHTARRLSQQTWLPLWGSRMVECD